MEGSEITGAGHDAEGEMEDGREKRAGIGMGEEDRRLEREMVFDRGPIIKSREELFKDEESRGDGW